jgi:chromosome partitioning protein
MTVIAVYNAKGGVGKTTTTVNLAFVAAEEGYRTLVWDLDPQGAAGFYLEADPPTAGSARRIAEGRTRLDALIRPTAYPNLHVIPSDRSYRKLDRALGDQKNPARRLVKLLSGVSTPYDLVFLDAPPSFALISEAIARAADALLVPVIPAPLSMRSLDQLEQHLAGRTRAGSVVLPFFSMVDRRKRLHRELSDERHDGRFLSTCIPLSAAVEQMGLRQAPLTSYDRRSAAARAYADLWREIEERLP